MSRPPWSVVFGFALGVASLLLGAVTGVPALLLSLRGLRAVNASDGRLGGARLAVAGLALGAFGTVVTTLGIGAIVALKLRATSQRAECMNNLRLIAFALEKYADARGSFPPATRDPAELSPERRLSWLTELMPLLGEGTRAHARHVATAGLVDRGAAWDAPANAKARETSVRALRCPDDPEALPGHTDYVGVAGLGERAAWLVREDGKAGVFGHDRGVTRREAANLSYTLSVIETAAENGPWIAGGPPTVRGVGDDERPIGPGRLFGGLHRGFGLGLKLDGSVETLSDKTAGDVLRRLVTLRDRE